MNKDVHQYKTGSMHKGKPRELFHKKLDPEKVREIRASKESVKVLAEKYGVTERQIHRVKTKFYWRHVQ